MESSEPVPGTPHTTAGTVLLVLGILVMAIGIWAVAFQTCTTSDARTVCSNPYSGGGIVAVVVGVFVLALGVLLFVMRGSAVSRAEPNVPPVISDLSSPPDDLRQVPEPLGSATPSSPSPADLGRVCASCGARNPEASEFCGGCGKALPPLA